jgi:hypothetical protein
VGTTLSGIVEYAENVPIVVRFLDEPLLTQRAIDASNRIMRAKNQNIKKSTMTITAMRYNYIRHKLTNYEDILENARSSTHYRKAHEIIKKRTQRAITLAYAGKVYWCR